MAHHIKNFVDSEEGPLNHILKKGYQLKLLNEKIMQHLRPELVKHCAVANFQDGLLRMVVDSAGFAIQLRYDIPELLKQLSFDETLPDIKAIDCYVDAEWGNMICRT